MTEPRLPQSQRLEAHLAKELGILSREQQGAIRGVVQRWLRRCARQAERDGASVAPEVIDNLIIGLNDGRL